jgi:PhoPQ-activated pathogenicity-related protein
MKKFIILTITLLLASVIYSIGASHYVTLTWTASIDSTSSMTYNVYRSVTSGTEGSTPIATGVAQGCSGTSCTWTDNNVVSGQQYFYEVAAVQGSTISPMSNETSCTVPLAGPTGVSCSGH